VEHKDKEVEDDEGKDYIEQLMKDYDLMGISKTKTSLLQKIKEVNP
jgi:hypothetical protein